MNRTQRGSRTSSPNAAERSPVNRCEVLVRAHRERGAAGVAEARALIESLGLVTATVAEHDSDVALDAFRRFARASAGR
jgi:uncharacterized protein with PIN domain